MSVVVYFNQLLGAAHPKHICFARKLKKVTHLEQTPQKKGFLSFHQNASQVFYSKKTAFSLKKKTFYRQKMVFFKEKSVFWE